MVKYLTNEEIIEIGKIALEITDESDKFQVKSHFDIISAMKFVEDSTENDLFKKALAYCIALFVYHPFQEGNHRVSLTTAERFLIVNGFSTDIDDRERMELQKWRVDYEEENDLERKFLIITCIEDKKIRNQRIKEVMGCEYAKKIEEWLRKNFKVATSEV